MTSADSERAVPPVATGTGAVLLLGGYGAVGRAAAAALVDDGTPVLVAGRDGDRAAALAERLGDRATGRALDAADDAGLSRVLPEVSAIVMCVERNNRPIAQLCIDRRVPFVDVSATSTVVASVAALDRAARRNGTSSLISVGLAPGVSNLLARAVHDERPDERAIDLTLLFGTAGDHGSDSRRWILDGLAQSPGDRRPKLVDVLGAGRRRAHPFPFSDQHTLAEALDATVTTRICFESRSVTSALFALRRRPQLSERPTVRALLDRAMRSVPFGSDRFVIQASASRPHGVVHAVTGNGECDATGRVAAAAVQLLLAGGVPPGVHHLDQVVDLGFLGGLSDVIEVHRSGPPRS